MTGASLSLLIHRMFMFQEDHFETPPTVKVEAYYPIKGSFSVQVKGK